MIQVLYSIWLIKISREEEFTRELLEVKRRDTWRSLCNPKEIPVRLYIGIEFSAGSNDEATFSPRTIKGAQSVFKEQLRRVLSSVVETHVLRPDNSIEYRGNKPVQLHIFILNGQHVEQLGGSSEKTTMTESVNLVGGTKLRCIWRLSELIRVSLFIYFILMMNIFSDFSILSWNVWGASSLRSKCHCRELISGYHPNLFVLLETHTQFITVASF